MKKFVVIYHMNESSMMESAKANPEEAAEGMKAWMTWSEKAGSQLIDFGTPLVGGQRLDKDGGAQASTREVAGYSIVEAEDMEAAKELMKGHPHLAWSDGCDIEIHETANPPGM
jgi:hypothetical protein